MVGFNNKQLVEIDVLKTTNLIAWMADDPAMLAGSNLET